MTKRRNLLVVIITLMLVCVFLTGCDGGDHDSAYIDDDSIENDAEEKSSKQENLPSVEGLVLINVVKIDGGSGHRDLYQFIMYDPETYIMFSYVEWIDGGGIFEMHNPDGSPRLYDPN